MFANLSLLYLRVINSLSQSPLAPSGCRSFTPFLSVSGSSFSRFSHSFVKSIFPTSVYAKSSMFSNFIDTCAVISSVDSGNFTTYQSFTSNTTVIFTNCVFHDITSSSPATAIYVLYASCNLTVASCNFQRLICTFQGIGYSSGGITVRSCYWVNFSSNYFSQVSSYDPTIYQVAPHYSSSVYNCAINKTTEYNTGTYGGYTCQYSAMSGGILYHCLSNNNHSAVKAGNHNGGYCVAVATVGNSFISSLMMTNCSGTSFWCAINCSYSFSVGRSIFRNISATSGIGEFYYSTMSICFSQCAFVSLPAVNLAYAYSSGFGFIAFERCCFDTPISATYLSIHIFISTINGNCVIERSGLFSAVFAYGLDPHKIFPLMLSALFLMA